MKLYLKNIGKIKQASVEINGITVIAGENNTGKSTVGKALYSVFNSFYDFDEQMRREKIRSVENILVMIYSSLTSKAAFEIEFADISHVIIDGKYENTEQLKEEIWKCLIQYDSSFEKIEPTPETDEWVARMYEALLITDEDFVKRVLAKNLGAEFYGQINNVFTQESAEIELEIKDENIKIEIQGDDVKTIDNRINLRTEVIYFDDPFILDEQRTVGFYKVYPKYMDIKAYMDHRMHLKHKLFANDKGSNVIDEIVIDNKFEKIYSKINEICDGDIVRSRKNSWGYKKANTDTILDVRNLSTGLKTFVILKTLLTKGIIEYNGTIILDEPEIHLHPEWQLLFAELIVLIQKEFGVHILLNTHSPYFLNAIEVYSEKYDVKEKCKYYLANMEGESSCLEDVTDNIEKIYSKLARPLQELENERYADD